MKNVLLGLTQNKNFLMLITASTYMLAVFAVLSGNLLLFSIILTIAFIISILKDLFPIKYILILTLIFYLGVINTSSRLKDIDELLNLAPLNSEITGTIISIPQGQAEGKPKFFFKVDKIKFGSTEKEFDNEKVLVTYSPPEDASFEGLKLYNSCILTGRLSAPFKAGNPSQFDYGNYLRNHNANAVFYAKDYKVIDNTPTFKERTLQKINNYREEIISVHSKYLKTPNLEILGGIVFGDDAVSPPQNIKKSFINSGLLHILAASGMNVAFIYSFFFMFMSLFKTPFKVKVSLGMIMVVIYSLMTGLGASVIRATCMLLFVLVGKLIDRDAHSISLLSFVALLMLLYNPLFINDVGFQLSFIVTFGILIMSPIIPVFKNKLGNFLAGTIAIPIIAQLWVIPIQIFYFSNISLYSVFANIMSVPILMVLSFGGFVSSLISVIRPIADIVCRVFDFVLNPLLTILVNISDFWGKMPHSALQTTHPNVLQILLYYGILLCVTGILRKTHIKTLLKTSLVFFAILLITLIPIKNTNLEITTFDVGNADCFLIKTPKNEYIMIDTAKSGYNGGKSQAEIIILKYLKDRGIKKINTIIVTHFDNDHCGGAVDLIKGTKVDKIYVNDLNHNSTAAKQIYETANKHNTELMLAQNNQTIYNESGVKLTNYIVTGNKNDNDNSILTLLSYNNFTMLFTGDSGAKSIKASLNNIPQNITVLKVPHHGANGVVDKEIIKYLNPKYSIISVGENKFGHPAIYTLKILDKSTILRTDINNAVKITANKDKINISTYNMSKRKFTKVNN